MRFLCLFALLSTAAAAADPVLDRVSAHVERFGAISRQIWETPEMGFHETKSAALLRDELRANGFTIADGVAGMPTGFTATWGSGKPVIGILGEFDALPGLSQKDVPTLDPVTAGAPGHGCGHNLLGSGAALAAVAAKEEIQARGLKGTIRFYGTPAEEGGGGKIYMIHAGLFRDVDAVLTWHPADRNSVNLRSNLANNGAKFRFYGIASHAAAAPEKGRSALDGALLMLHAIEMLREHVPQETRMHYIISNGGSAANIVPAFAEVTLVARHPNMTTLDGIWQRVLKCAQAGALATETRVEIEQGTNYANTLPNDALNDVVGRAMRKAGGYQYTPAERAFAEQIQKSFAAPPNGVPGPDTVQTDASEGSGMASSDVGDVSWVVPTLSFTAATYTPGTAAHSWQAAAQAGTSIGRKGMEVAARTLALSIMDLVENPTAIDAVKTSFEKRRAGRTWTTHIAPGAAPPLDYWKTEVH
ncbi:MAG TPA: amidohydrolase [Candidatus Sulfopaludibacter sp.]|jgi:aminobenzoyl-glutamate utilization protein B|nr:amidohydrolase [Candidatus Sulfopaludibacter sp.]